MRQPIIPQLDGQQFLDWECAQAGKFELHHGFVFAFAGGTADHDRLAFNIRQMLEREFSTPCRTFGSDIKIQIETNTYYYADAGVICEPLDGRALAIECPRVVVEVLSPSTRAYDQVEKRAAYRSIPSLRAYVIVYPEMRRIEVDRHDLGGRWVTDAFDDDGFVVDGHAFALNDVYRFTTLADE